MSPKVLVAGIGNIFLGDDGFGVEVARRLTALGFPDSIKIADFGIRALDLAYSLTEEWELVILVDLVQRGGPPGTLYVIEADLNNSASPELLFDGHSLQPATAMEMAKRLGGLRSRVLIVGCEPLVTGEDHLVGLSAPVNSAVDEAVLKVRDLAMEAVSQACS
jgi:hydrogenase maturation protease